jgi:hypothetical protein
LAAWGSHSQLPKRPCWAIDDSGHTGTTANSMASIVKKVCVVFFFCRAALLAIKLIDSPFTNDLRQFQEIAGGAPLAMVAVAIDYVSPELGCLCHYQIKFPLRQLIKLLKLNRSVKQVTFKPLWI